MHFIAVLNRGAGTFRTMDLKAFTARARTVFEGHGHTIDWVFTSSRHVERHLRHIAADRTVDAVIAGGGDGTISAAAGIAFETGVPLAVLPAGTMNLFARALKMPLSLPDALEAIAGGVVGSVDIATANNRPFVHHFGVGIHPRLVQIRDGMPYKNRAGKMLAGLRSIALAAVDPPNFETDLQTPGRLERQRVSGIAISNNPFGDGHIPHADSLDTGLLGIYLAAPLSTPALIKLWSEVLLGRWRESDAVTEKKVSEIVLHFPKHRPGLRAVLDGELVRLERTVHFRVHRGALNMVLPRALDQ
jgi:diacylglycerol kinase family enzyme